MPSAARNELLCTVKDDIESEVGTIENFPIRGMDFDSENKILYTGDEMGYLHKWDLSKLISKLVQFDKQVDESKGQNTAEMLHDFKKSLKQFETTGTNDDPKDIEEEKKEPKKASFRLEQDEDSSTFMTEAMLKAGKGTDPVASKAEENKDKDVILLNRWKAHTDGITWVTYNNDPPFIVTSSFDKNVYIWNDKCERIGSLVLGHDKFWNIKIDKSDRIDRERREAEEMLDLAEKDDSETATKDKSTRERDLKIMKQIRLANQRKNMKNKPDFDDSL